MMAPHNRRPRRSREYSRLARVSARVSVSTPHKLRRRSKRQRAQAVLQAQALFVPRWFLADSCWSVLTLVLSFLDRLADGGADDGDEPEHDDADCHQDEQRHVHDEVDHLRCPLGQPDLQTLVPAAPVDVTLPNTSLL